MGVYHITYTPELKELCLYFNGGCQFSCHGCITDWHPVDCHLEESIRAPEHPNTTLRIEEVIFYLKALSFERVIFLGKEPAGDTQFLPLAKYLKDNFHTYNILLTNGWDYIAGGVLDEVCISIKAVSEDIFKDFTKKDSPVRVLENFKRYARDPKIKLRAESIFIPGYIDKKEIEKIAKFIATINHSIPYRIDGYIPHRKDSFPGPTEEEMNEAKLIAEGYLKNVSILHYGVKVKYKVERIY